VVSVRHAGVAGGAAFVRTWAIDLRRPGPRAYALVQPVLWLALFGFLLRRYDVTDVAPALRYFDFFVPGVCGMTVLFGASLAGRTVLRDRCTGMAGRILWTPAPRLALLFGVLTATTSRLLVQALLVALVALALGAQLSAPPLPLLVGGVAAGLFGFAYAGLSCALAWAIRNSAVMNVLTHTLNVLMLLTSSVFVPVDHMPDWLATIATFNPLTLTVDALRAALLGLTPPDPVWNCGVLSVVALVLFAVAVTAQERAA